MLVKDETEKQETMDVYHSIWGKVKSIKEMPLMPKKENRLHVAEKSIKNKKDFKEGKYPDLKSPSTSRNFYFQR